MINFSRWSAVLELGLLSEWGHLQKVPDWDPAELQMQTGVGLIVVRGEFDTHHGL